MPITNLQPTVNTSPDQGGTLAVSGATNTGHGSTGTSASVLVGIGGNSASQSRSCRWSSFQSAPFGTIVSLRLRFSWSASGSAIANADVGGGANASCSFAIEYTLNGGSSWIPAGGDSASASGNDSDNLSSSGNADIALSTSQNLSQVQVRVRTDASASASAGDLGSSGASASVTSSVSDIRIEAETSNPSNLIVMM